MFRALLVSQIPNCNYRRILVKRYPYMTDVYVKTAYLEEAEYILLEVMDCCLIVYQPYRPLVQIINVSSCVDFALMIAFRTCGQPRSGTSTLFIMMRGEFATIL
jgi:hypothetical protein